MATLIPESYSTRFGGLPGTTAYIEQYGSGWVAHTWDEYHVQYVIPMRRTGVNYWTWEDSPVPHVFATPQEAADAAEQAIWL